MLRSRRGQSTLEYTIVIAVVVGALIAMQIYMKRGIAGKLRSSTDQIGEQYSPGLTTGGYTTITGSTSEEVVSEGKTTTTVNRGFQNRTGNETVSALSEESE